MPSAAFSDRLSAVRSFYLGEKAGSRQRDIQTRVMTLIKEESARAEVNINEALNRLESDPTIRGAIMEKIWPNTCKIRHKTMTETIDRPSRLSKRPDLSKIFECN